MKTLFSFVFMLLTSHSLVAQNQKGIPDWFTHPVKGEFVGVSLSYDDNKAKEKSAEYSAILSYLLSLRKERMEPDNSSKSKNNLFDTLSVYSLLLEDGRSIGEMKIKINRQTQIAYADQDALDKGRIENSTTIYDSYVSFYMKCGFELCHKENKNRKSQTPTVGHSASLANKWQNLKLKE